MKQKVHNKIKNEYWFLAVLMLCVCSLSGCSTIGEKSTSMAIIYGVIALVSLALLAAYCVAIRKKEVWFLVLFTSIFIVNTGYFALAISQTLEEALLANRIAYLGSVFLPLAMLMIIMNVCKLKYKMWFPIVLLVISVAVFVIAASPGYLDIYYKTVTIEKIDGVAVLKKTYGSWHCVYLYYLITYFAMIVFMTFRGWVKKKVESPLQSFLLSGVAFLNICVWLLGQLIDMDFEFLSVSYVISEVFLLFLCLLMQEEAKKKDALSEEKSGEPGEPGESDESGEGEDNLIIDGTEVNEVGTEILVEDETDEIDEEIDEELNQFMENLQSLTPTEKNIYSLYLEGKSTKEVLELMNIKENTLKYHNKNIYGKLHVSSRKQLIEIAKRL